MQCKKDGKDQESIQSSATPDPGYQCLRQYVYKLVILFSFLIAVFMIGQKSKTTVILPVHPSVHLSLHPSVSHRCS